MKLVQVATIAIVQVAAIAIVQVIVQAQAIAVAAEVLINMKYITTNTKYEAFTETKVFFVSHIVSVESAIFKYGTDMRSIINTVDGKNTLTGYSVQEIMEMISNANS